MVLTICTLIDEGNEASCLDLIERLASLLCKKGRHSFKISGWRGCYCILRVTGIVIWGDRHAGGTGGGTRWRWSAVLRIQILLNLRKGNVSTTTRNKLRRRIPGGLEPRGSRQESCSHQSAPQMVQRQVRENGWEVCNSEGQISSMTVEKETERSEG